MEDSQWEKIHQLLSVRYKMSQHIIIQLTIIFVATITIYPPRLMKQNCSSNLQMQQYPTCMHPLQPPNFPEIFE